MMIAIRTGDCAAAGNTSRRSAGRTDAASGGGSGGDVRPQDRQAFEQVQGFAEGIVGLAVRRPGVGRCLLLRAVAPAVAFGIGQMAGQVGLFELGCRPPRVRRTFSSRMSGTMPSAWIDRPLG